MMPDPNCTPSLLQYTPIVTWVLVIIGWLLINHQHNRRETRKEIRARIDAIQDDLKALENSAIEYHTEKPSSENARRIKASISQLNVTIGQLSTPLKNHFTPELIQLRQSITLRHFDVFGIGKIAISNEIIDDIGFAVHQLSSSLEDKFTKQYYTPWHQRFIKCF